MLNVKTQRISVSLALTIALKIKKTAFFFKQALKFISFIAKKQKPKSVSIKTQKSRPQSTKKKTEKPLAVKTQSFGNSRCQLTASIRCKRHTSAAHVSATDDSIQSDKSDCGSAKPATKCATHQIELAIRFDFQVISNMKKYNQLS